MRLGERLLGVSTFTGKALEFKLTRQVKEAKGNKPNNFLQEFVFSDSFNEMGSNIKEAEKLGLTKILSELTYHWFLADSYLDSQPLGEKSNLEIDFRQSLKDKQSFIPVERAINSSQLSEKNKTEIIPLIHNFEQISLQAHISFIKEFKPFETPYNAVMDYRQKTTGTMAEMFISISCLSLNIDKEKTEKFINLGRDKLIALQMLDDMVDSVADFGNLPNLFNSLLLKRPKDFENFLMATKNEKILKTKKPFEIASLAAPETLNDYLDRFKKTIGNLSSEQKKIYGRMMGAATFFSFTPEIFKGQRVNIFSLMSKGTKK